MTGQNQKPREFWIETHETIRGQKNREGFQSWPQVYETQMPNTIRVIEYSVYEAEVKNRVEWFKKLKAECEKNAKLIEALKEVTKLHCGECNSIIMRAFKEVES